MRDRKRGGGGGKETERRRGRETERERFDRGNGNGVWLNPVTVTRGNTNDSVSHTTMTGGLCKPVEGNHRTESVGNFLPTTLEATAFRSIPLSGWPLTGTEFVWSHWFPEQVTLTWVLELWRVGQAFQAGLSDRIFLPQAFSASSHPFWHSEFSSFLCFKTHWHNIYAC